MTEPKFTDEDLKRLKELLDKGDFQTIEVYEADWIWKRFKALLARLESSERLAERFQDNTPEDTGLVNAWRKTCGR